MRRITFIHSPRGGRLRVAAVAALGAALAVPASASAATDQFLRLSGSQYDGESQDSAFPGTIEITSSSFAVKRASRIGTPTFGNLIVTKRVDRSSPALMLAAAGGGGKGISSAHLQVRKAGSAPRDTYLSYCFQNVVVMSDQIDNTTGDDQPEETVTLSYQAVTQSYSPTEADGTLDQPIVAGWSLIQNAAISVFPTTCGR